MRILKENCLALVIDIQERLHPHISDFDALEKNTCILIHGLKALGVPMLVTQQYSKALGETIPSVKDAIGEFTSFEKITFSCWGEASISEAIKASGRKAVIIVGEESHICIQQTAIDLVANGYLPVIVTDCVSSRKQWDKEIALKRLCKEGALLTSYESLLFELCQAAGNDTFKIISKLVK